MSIPAKIAKIAIPVAFFVWALIGPKKFTFKVCNPPDTRVVTVTNLREEKVYNIIQVDITPADVIDSSESTKPANETIDSGESIKPVYTAIDSSESTKPANETIDSSESIKPVYTAIDSSESTKPANETIDSSESKDIIQSPKMKSMELKQFLALEAKVEELILRIEAKSGSWDINKPSNKASLEYTMNLLSEHANGIHQMQDNPQDLQEYLKRRGSIYPYDTLDAFLKKHDFNGVYKGFNKKVESVDSNDNVTKNRKRRE